MNILCSPLLCCDFSIVKQIFTISVNNTHVFNWCSLLWESKRLPANLHSGQQRPKPRTHFLPYVISSLLSRFHLAPRMCLLLVYRSVRRFKYLLLCTVSLRLEDKR